MTHWGDQTPQPAAPSRLSVAAYSYTSRGTADFIMAFISTAGRPILCNSCLASSFATSAPRVLRLVPSIGTGLTNSITAAIPPLDLRSTMLIGASNTPSHDCRKQILCPTSPPASRSPDGPRGTCTTSKVVPAGGDPKQLWIHCRANFTASSPAANGTASTPAVGAASLGNTHKPTSSRKRASCPTGLHRSHAKSGNKAPPLPSVGARPSPNTELLQPPVEQATSSHANAHTLGAVFRSGFGNPSLAEEHRALGDSETTSSNALGSRTVVDARDWQSR